MNNSLQVESFEPDALAYKIADMWVRWDDNRAQWKADCQELRQYLFATDTRKTSNGKVGWNNSTVTPKLTQIRDNLHANYMAALFPSEDWFYWESSEKTPEALRKRESIVAYMKQKLKASNFQLLTSQLIYDYIDFGNVFVTYDFINDLVKSENGYTQKYIGPKAYRVSPYDVVFNPVASDFESTPLLRRMLKSIGDLQNDIDTKPSLGYNKDTITKILDFRQRMVADAEFKKTISLEIDGFGTIDEYINSDMVELIEFWGDMFNVNTRKLEKNLQITIVDRRWILAKRTNPLWTGAKPFYHCGWRLKPDHLWAQGPLDQLVGLQYRVDHLENLKADVFDQISYPVIKVKGNTVEQFEYEPGAVVFCGDEGDVEFMRPDATALQADLQIEQLMNRMEELAGAPKQAMGIRTPGEKTKYEVQSLDNAAGRIFQSKTQWFEKNILEPLLNGMLAEAVRNFQGVEQIRTVDPDFNVEIFIEVTKEDLIANGKLYPVGARHFAEQAKFVQELAQTVQTVQAIPTVAAHISGKAIAKALEENLGWMRYGIVKDNVAIMEQQETQQLINQAHEEMAAQAAVGMGQPPEGAPPQM